MREHSSVFITYKYLIHILAFFATIVRFGQQMAAFTRDTQHKGAQVSGPAHDAI